MTIPSWLAVAIVGILLAQLVAVVRWGMRADSRLALIELQLVNFGTLLTKHSLDVLRSEMDQRASDIRELWQAHERNRNRIDEVHDEVREHRPA